MAQRYEVIIGLTYPTDLQVAADLHELGRQAREARELAVASHDPRDVDAANTADAAASAAVRQAIESGLLKRVEPGDVTDDIPAQSLPWLLEQGCVRRAVDGEVKGPEAVPRECLDIGRPEGEDSAVDHSHDQVRED